MNLVVLIAAVLIAGASGARILAVIPTPFYSHHAAFQPLWKQLSLKGHQVTVVTIIPNANGSLTNLTEIDVGPYYVGLDEMNMNEHHSVGAFHMGLGKSELFKRTMEVIFNHPSVKKLIQDESEHFDLVFFEGHTSMMYYFAHRFKCPLIALYSFEASSKIYRDMGNPTHPALYPDISLSFAAPLTFLQRLKSIIYEAFAILVERTIDYKKVETQAKVHFGKDIPSLSEMDKTISAIFTNTDAIVHPVRPLLPNIVEIADGSPVKFTKPISPDLKKRLDSATQHGFIYFSMGSLAKSRYLPEATLRTIVTAFSQLPQLVLWKFEAKAMFEVPSNVIISDWFPQENILKHPNIRAFLTQSGRESMLESIHNGVPMVGLPLYADQFKNVQSMVTKGMGLEVNFNALEVGTLIETIQEVIKNPKYKQAVIKASELAQDQPMTGLDKAIWWTEYVLRNKGTEHLRSPALDIPWYQYLLLDVMTFITFVVLLVLFILKLLFRSVFRFIGSIFQGKVKSE